MRLHRRLNVTANDSLYVRLDPDTYVPFPVSLTDTEFTMGDIPVYDNTLNFNHNQAGHLKQLTLDQSSRVSHISVRATNVNPDTLTVTWGVLYPDDNTYFEMDATGINITNANPNGTIHLANNMIVFPSESRIRLRTAVTGVTNPSITVHIITVPAVV